MASPLFLGRRKTRRQPEGFSSEKPNDLHGTVSLAAVVVKIYVRVYRCDRRLHGNGQLVRIRSANCTACEHVRVGKGWEIPPERVGKNRFCPAASTLCSAWPTRSHGSWYAACYLFRQDADGTAQRIPRRASEAENDKHQLSTPRPRAAPSRRSAMKYRILISTLFVALAVLGSVAAVADTTQPTQILTGKVISSTPTQLIVEDDNGARTTFVVNAGAVPSTIMVGDRISVNYQSQAGGSFRATNVSATSLSTNKVSDATGVNSNDTSTNDAMVEEVDLLDLHRHVDHHLDLDQHREPRHQLARLRRQQHGYLGRHPAGDRQQQPPDPAPRPARPRRLRAPHGPPVRTLR